jgi:hypothetical protein
MRHRNEPEREKETAAYGANGEEIADLFAERRIYEMNGENPNQSQIARRRSRRNKATHCHFEGMKLQRERLPNKRRCETV